MDIKTATVEALKSLAYDSIVAIENAQKNLQAINAELVLRSQDQVASVQPEELPKE